MISPPAAAIASRWSRMGDACCIHGVGWRTCLARKASAAFPGADPDVAELKGNTSACGVDVVAEPQSDRKDPPSEGLSTRGCGRRFFSSLALQLLFCFEVRALGGGLVS